MKWKNWILWPALSLLFFFGAVAYTWPAFQWVTEGRKDIFMSNGTDLTAAVFHFGALHDAYLKDPSLLLYGAFPHVQMDAPYGEISWFSPTEKIAGLLIPFFVPLEQVTTIYALLLITASGLAFFAMGRLFKWPDPISLALSIAWAFSTYIRARAQVHTSLDGLYFLPILICAILLLRGGPTRRHGFAAGLCFFGWATAPHYYLIMSLFFFPFFFLFVLSDSELRTTKIKFWKPVFMAILPAVLFLGWSFLKPAPSEAVAKTQTVLPLTAAPTVGPHPFLIMFAAKPIDYFTGDIAIGAEDINPLRKSISTFVRSNLGYSNTHERTAGIRWTIWLCFLVSLVVLIRRNRNEGITRDEKLALGSFLGLAIFAFMTSLEPDWGFMWGPVYWLNSVVAQIRVPNRASLFVHFSVLVLIGMTFTWLWQQAKAKQRKFFWALPLIVFLDFPPFMNDMPGAPIVPARAEKLPGHGHDCGIGFQFPYVSGAVDSLRYYYLMQSMRGTDCSFLNASYVSARNEIMDHAFGLTQGLVDQINANSPFLKSRLIHFLTCNHVHWATFDTRIPQPWTQDVCQSLGGSMIMDDLCQRSPEAIAQDPPSTTDQCLKEIQ